MANYEYNEEESNNYDDDFGLPELDSNPQEDANNSDYGTVDDSRSRYKEDSDGYGSEVHKEKSNTGIILTVIFILTLLLGVTGWYFFYYQPQKKAAEKAKQEQIVAEKAKKEKERLAEEKLKEEERLRAEEEARLKAEEDAKPKIGAIETISQRTSRYYIIVSSGIDDDLAMDYAKKEVNNGANIKLLSPLGINKFYRVSVADYDSWVAALNALDGFKSTFGNDIWILKY